MRRRRCTIKTSSLIPGLDWCVMGAVMNHGAFPTGSRVAPISGRAAPAAILRSWARVYPRFIFKKKSSNVNPGPSSVRDHLLTALSTCGAQKDPVQHKLVQNWFLRGLPPRQLLLIVILIHRLSRWEIAPYANVKKSWSHSPEFFGFCSTATQPAVLRAADLICSRRCFSEALIV